MSKKVRVNISVDSILLNKARKKLDLFGGKLSTLFNAYLNDFVKSIDSKAGEKTESIMGRIKDLEKRVKKLEG